MENAYYTQYANELFPIFGASSIEEARSFIPEEEWGRIVESADRVLMNPNTGSVDFESGWDTLAGLVEVRYSAEDEAWVEA